MESRPHLAQDSCLLLRGKATRSPFHWRFAGALAGGILGYRSKQPLYLSDGPSLKSSRCSPRFLTNARDKTLPMFDQFMDAQVRACLSRAYQ